MRNVIHPKMLLCLIFMSCFFACKKLDTIPGRGTLNLELVAGDFVAPLSVVEPPDGSKRLFVVDEIGKVWIVGKTDGKKMPFLDLTSKMVTLNPGYDERGLLSLAFHPDFASNHKFYVFYTAPPRSGGPQPGASWNNLTRISEFTVSAGNPDMADLNSERVILEEDHPQLNHNGGTIAFGPDGYLYISIGDGGASDDNAPGHVDDWYKVNKGGNGQDIYHNLMGNVLRIDINHGSPYSIPADNPFVNTKAKPEIYAYGFRNPYRFSFDMGGLHQLLLGDAGQGLWEEINLVHKGGNYGWNVKEGTICFSTDNDEVPRSACPMEDTAGNPLIDPVIQLKNFANPSGGGITTVVVGGNVYRGLTLPGLNGYYLFGSFSKDGGANGKLYKAAFAGTHFWPFEEVKLKDYPDHLGMYLKGFGQDLRGEVYLATSMAVGLTGTSGKIFKLVKE